MNKVRKTELFEIGQELTIISDRLNRTKNAVLYETRHSQKLDSSIKVILNAQNHTIGAIFEISKITG